MLSIRIIAEDNELKGTETLITWQMSLSSNLAYVPQNKKKIDTHATSIIFLFWLTQLVSLLILFRNVPLCNRSQLAQWENHSSLLSNWSKQGEQAGLPLEFHLACCIYITFSCRFHESYLHVTFIYPRLSYRDHTGWSVSLTSTRAGIEPPTSWLKHLRTTDPQSHL